MQLFRPFSVTCLHGKSSIKIGSLLYQRTKKPYIALSGEVGYHAGGINYAADLFVTLEKDVDFNKTLKGPPILLVEILSTSNYETETDFLTKIQKSVKNGTSAAWIVHPGVLGHKTGVQVVTGDNVDSFTIDVHAKFENPNNVLFDGGLNLGIKGTDLLE